jgi:TetR/AcrR family transcriptional repressor of nem operon
MARPKEFDREAVLAEAIGVFAQHGFEGSSTEALLNAMGISRQSLYDTFGDKWQLYLAALQRYVADSIGAQLLVLEGPPDALDGIAALLLQAAAKAGADPAPACLGISAICEFGRSAPDLQSLTDTSGRVLLQALERRLGEAIRSGRAPADLDVPAAAQFLLATLTGIKVAARSGACASTLQGIARMALRSLR